MSAKEKPKSASSAKSKQSQGSIGMGTGTPSKVIARHKFLVDGFTSLDGRLHDCVVVLIFCAKHRNIAVSSTRREHIVWTPFMQLAEGISWKEGTLDCIQRIFRTDAEQSEADAGKEMPKFDLSCFEVTRIQLPSVNVITRICQLVTLKEGNSFKCCTKTANIEWMPLATLAKETPSDSKCTHWGPELQLWCNKLEKALSATSEKTKEHTLVVLHERNIQQEIFKYFASEQKNLAEHKALLGIKLKHTHAAEVYEDYLKHCYPSLYMHCDSFSMYLSKYLMKPGEEKHTSIKSKKTHCHFPEQDPRAGKLFDLFCTTDKHYLSYKQLLIGLVVMDPNCKDKCELRIRFLFRYYANGKPSFTESEFKLIVADLHPNGKNDCLELYSQTLKNFEVTRPEQVTFTIFYKSIIDGKLDVSRLLRLEQSVLSLASPQFGHKVTTKKSFENPLVTVIKDQGGECQACCQTTVFEYCMNSVTIDTEGRAVKPNIINYAWLQESCYQVHRKYSMDITFSNEAICNIFLDLIRAFNRQKGATGLMTDDVNCFLRNFKLLLHLLDGIFQAESKLIKLNGPAIVIGDLRGCLSDLLTIEETLFPTFPVKAESLIFLGNYTGEFQNGVECLLYLFSLKVASANKVFLLRGKAETRAVSSHSLRDECYRKYGIAQGGVIFEAFNDIFAKMPIAVILDESCLCVHSGIPSSNRKIEDVNHLPVEMFDIQKDGPIAYEIITRFPVTKNTSHKPDNTWENIYGQQRQGDLAFHNTPRSSSSISIASRSYIEAPLKSTEIKSYRKTEHHSNERHLDEGKQKHQNSTLSKQVKSSEQILSRALKSNVSMKGRNKTRRSKPNSNTSIKSSHLKSMNGSIKVTKSTRAKSSERHPSLKSKRVKSAEGAVKQVNLTVKSAAKTNSKNPINNKSAGRNRTFSVMKTKSSEQARKSISTRHKSSSFFPSGGNHHNAKDEETFDGSAFREFMSFNNLVYLIRSGSVCKYGYKINFKNCCFSIISCSKIGNYKNKACALLVDRQPFKLRFVGLKMTNETKGTSNTTLG